MSPDEEKNWTLVSCKDTPFPVGQLEKAISAVLEVPLADARMIGRRARGILLEDLLLNQARSLQSACEHVGLSTLILPSDEVVGTIPMKQVRQIRPSDDHLKMQISFRTDELRPLPWEHIDMVSAGLVGTQAFWSKTRDRAVKNLPMLKDISDHNLREELTQKLADRGIGKDRPEDLSLAEDAPEVSALKEIEHLAKNETQWLVDVYCMNVPVRYRLKRNEAIFPHLKSENEQVRRSEENFLHVLTELLFTGKDFITTPISMDIHSGNSYFEHVFDDMNAFHRYSRWYLTMVQQGEIEPGPVIPSMDRYGLGKGTEEKDQDEVESDDGKSDGN